MAARASGQSPLETGLRTLSTAAFVGAVTLGLTGRTVLFGAAAIVFGIASALVTRSRSNLLARRRLIGAGEAPIPWLPVRPGPMAPRHWFWLPPRRTGTTQTRSLACPCTVSGASPAGEIT